MAKKTQEGLLGEVVQLLRKQNQLSTRDRLKEAEEVKRQQKMDEDALNPATDDRGQVQITDSLDFTRRYKANIAGKVTKTKMDEPKNKAKKKVQEVIKHSTFMTRRLIEKANKMMFRINIENTNRDLLQMQIDAKKHKDKMRNDEEYRREHGGEMFDFTKSFRKMIAGFLSPRELARQKKREEWSIIKENWFKYGVIPLIGALTVGIGLAYNGIHLWHLKVVAALAAVKLWASNKWFKPGMFLDSKYISLRTSIYAWFGYDKAGRPMERKVGGKWTTFGWAGMVDGVKARIAAIRLKAFNSIGLGVDGKALGNRPGPRGSVMTQAAWKSAGFIGLVTRRITTLMSPLVKVSGGIAKWTGGKSYKFIADLLKTFANLGAVKFLGRLLWPITAIFSIFEGFKSGKTEAEREGSKWYTVLGESIGGVMGYLVGGLADAIKGIIVWGIKKMFGFKTDKDGKIIEGQGIAGDALKAVDEFSFMDLVRKIVAFPYHAISAVADFIGDLFSDPVGMISGSWDFITDLPSKFMDMIKSFIPNLDLSLPDWLGGGSWNLREALGIDSPANIAANGPDDIKHHVTNPFTGKKWTKGERQTMNSKLGENWRSENQEGFLKMMYDFSREQQAAGKYGGSGTGNHYTRINQINQYKDEGYGDYIKATRLEATM